MKALAKATAKNLSSSAAARPQTDRGGPLLQRKAAGETDALSRIISSGRPVNAYGPPADSNPDSKTGQLISLVQRTKVQPKLTVGRPNDKYEQEADSVAERVMRMPGPQIRPKPT